jgi:hypothetical protein
MPFALNHGNRRALNEASASLTVPEPPIWTVWMLGFSTGVYVHNGMFCVQP